MLRSSSKAVNISVHITILKKLNLHDVLIWSFEQYATSTDNQNFAHAVPVDLSWLTLFYIFTCFYLLISKKKKAIFSLNTKNTFGPFIWLGFMSVKARGLLQSGSLLLKINFQGILMYFIGLSNFKGWVNYCANWRLILNPFTWST